MRIKLAGTNGLLHGRSVLISDSVHYKVTARDPHVMIVFADNSLGSHHLHQHYNSISLLLHNEIVVFWMGMDNQGGDNSRRNER